LYANSNNNIIHIWKILRQENGRKISLRERIHNNLCFCPIYGTLCTIPFLLSACITKALLFKHWRPGKESYIYDKGQLLWKSYISRINTAHWHKLKNNKQTWLQQSSNKPAYLITLTSQAKPTSSTLQCQNQPGIIWQACRQFACIFCNVDLYIQSDTAAGKENILNESNLPWYLYRSNSLCNRLCGVWISFPV